MSVGGEEKDCEDKVIKEMLTDVEERKKKNYLMKRYSPPRGSQTIK